MNIIVQTSSWDATVGVLFIGGARYDCTLGRGGVTLEKAEGDGKTPVGTYPLRQLIYRADRIAQPQTGLPAEILTPDTGWCEDASHADYNTKVTLPHPAVCDRMTRDDHLYDMTVVIGYNDAPVVAGRGSAIFMHLAREEWTPTAGCVGLKQGDLIEVLKHLTPDSHITILPPPA
ncbi:MAG: L,D-transpeptidase family protein [Alphaproteobacteria bacterium]|nr:L,D-transpeptidase family protein [Alphaproteobacteria bacterium]